MSPCFSSCAFSFATAWRTRWDRHSPKGSVRWCGLRSSYSSTSSSFMTVKGRRQRGHGGRTDLVERDAMNRVHFSSRTDQWPTPQWLFDLLDSEFDFGWDV